MHFCKNILSSVHFPRRNKVMNHFNLMLQKRLKNEEDEEIDEEEKGKGKKGAKNRKSKGYIILY